MTIKMIIATGLNGEIGKDNKLLWKIPEDLKYFKAQTENQIVLMGSTTYEGLPFKNGLPSRDNIVLSRTPRKAPWLTEGFTTYLTDIDWFLHNGMLYIETLTEKDVWIVGGSSVYEQFKDIVEEVHHTTVNKTFPEADCHFDMDWVRDETKFECVSSERLCEEATVRVYKRK